MNKVYGTLGMAMRARKLSMGEAVLDDIRSKKAKLVIIASDASENTKKKIVDKCHYYDVEYAFIESSMLLNQAIGKTNRMAVAVIEEGFAKSIKTCLKG
ncbi:MAG: 50S ribosomal protein L7ae [Erysipelotrichia bacterium]|nr:50S ribosomal protein L7ae [Erysipelotrichia bacterium]NCC53943.1 50S ribosomal protein L7ae [Erysipelotrichia bacterium]